eukprot:Clim_evm259s157 gene=Clim_evmTU259s157
MSFYKIIVTVSIAIIATCNAMAAPSQGRRQATATQTITFVNKMKNTLNTDVTLGLVLPSKTSAIFYDNQWDSNSQYQLPANTTVEFEMYPYCNTDTTIAFNALQDNTSSLISIVTLFTIATSSDTLCLLSAEAFEGGDPGVLPAIMYSVEPQTLWNTGPTVYICTKDDYLYYLNSCNF